VKTEEYNGTTWAANAAPGELPTGTGQAGCAGTQTAALKIGGNPPPGSAGTQVVEYNGTTWSVSPVSLPTAFGKGGSSQAGTQTSALAYGGNISPNQQTESWDGTSWTEVANLATAKRAMGTGMGSPSSTGIVFGGNAPPAPAVPNTNATEEWTAPIALKTLASTNA